MKQKPKKENIQTGKHHGSRLSVKIKDKEAVKKIFHRFKTVGINLIKPIKFKIKPWYHRCYSNVINVISETLTFYIPAGLRNKIETIISKGLNTKDRLLLEVNDKHLLIVKLSKHATSFKFTIAVKKTRKYEIEKSLTTKFRLLEIAKYEEIVQQIINEYTNGKDIATLEAGYPLSNDAIRRILKRNGIKLRSHSQQQTLRFHGRLPDIKVGLSIEKLKVIFAIMGDNIGNVESKGYKIGICGEDLDFIRTFADVFEKEYGIRPSTHKDKRRNVFIVSLKNKDIFNDLRRYAQFGSHNWKLLDNSWKYIKKMNYSDLGEAVCYFWEAEGCPMIKNKTIEATSVNYKGLKQIQRIMYKVGIRTTITGPNFAASSNGLYTLRTSGRENIKLFIKLVNFLTLRKRAGVKEMLSSYKRIIKIHSHEEYTEAFKFKKKGFTLTQISKELNISPRTLKSWFYEKVKPCPPGLRAHHLP